MSWFGSIGCSTGGALLVSLVSVWLAGRLHELCQSATGRSRQLLTCLIIMPFFLPGLVVGYTFRQISLNLVHSPFINTGLYFLLITARSVPVGVLLHGLIPRPALSPAGRHCLRSAVGRGFVGPAEY